MGDNFGKRIDLFGREEETRSYLQMRSMIEPPKPLAMPHEEMVFLTEQEGAPKTGQEGLPETDDEDLSTRLAETEVKINQLVQYIADQNAVSVPKNADLERSYELEGAEITEVVPGDGIDVDNPIPGQFIVSVASKFLEQEEVDSSETDLSNELPGGSTNDLLRHDGEAWVALTAPTADSLLAYEAAAGTWGYVEGAANKMIYHNGTGWAALAAPSGAGTYMLTWTTAGLAWTQGTQITAVTTYQVDGANSKFQKKTRTAYVAAAGAESGWTDVHTGTVCA